MKNAIILCSLFAVMILTACNNLFKGSETEQVKFTTHREALDTLKEKYMATRDTVAAKVIKEDTVIYNGPNIVLMRPDSAREFLSKVDFAQILSSPGNNPSYPEIYNGFFGTDRYRIEFYLSDVSRDSTNPMLVSVKGKTRFKKNIVNFLGTISIDSVFWFYNPAVAKYWEDYGKGIDKSYHLSGEFNLAEENNKWGAGKYNGRFYMDISVNENDEPQYWFYKSDEFATGPSEAVKTGEKDSLLESFIDVTKPTRGAGFLFDGNWISNVNSTTKPLLLAKDVFMFGNDILEHFSYGEREIEIDPKYASLGWDNYWENDEWYHDENAKVMMIFR